MDIQGLVPQKSPNDSRQYEAINLTNGAKVLLIHDSQITKSACSISVGVGSLEDFDSSLGIAHFLEHMLFMGSQKYHTHNEYSSFISLNSGFDNAYTSEQETNFYFEIKNNAFNEAIERLTNFFTSALLNKDCIQKQRQAVHEEYVLWTNDDNCRKWQVLRKMGCPPYSRFSIGNQQTLNHQKIQEDLVGFYKQYYSSNILTAALCSNQSIQDMKKNLLPHFACIANKNVQLPIYDLHFKKQNTNKLIFMESIKDESIMEFFFVLDQLKPLYKEHVSDYLTHVIGHEGKNSLLSILKQKQYATELSTYSHDLKTQTLLGVEIKLTEAGNQQYHQIYNIVMDYLSSLKAERQIFQEIKEVKNIQFKFKEKTKVSNYVCKLSSKMHYIPLDQILNHSSLFDEYNEELITKFLSQLNPFNVIIVFSNNEQLDDATLEKYLGAKYRVENLPERKTSSQQFKCLEQNVFIPVDITLFEKQEGHSNVVPEKLGQNLYFLHDTSFNVCKGGIQVRIYNKEDQTFMEFYAKYLEMLAKQTIYPAETLNAEISFYSEEDCIVISVFSFNHTASKLVEEIRKIAYGHNNQTIFNITLDDEIEDMENFYTQEADEIGDGLRDIILNKGTPTIQQSLQVLKNFDYHTFVERINKFWKETVFSWIVVGNFKSEQVKVLVQNFQITMRKEAPSILKPEVNCLKLNKSLQYGVVLTSEELSSSCCIVHYEFGFYSERLFYMMNVLKNHIDEPFFNELRTQKQLAYSLFTQILNTRGILALQFTVVSSTKDPYEISLQIKHFVQAFFADLDNNLGGHKLQKIKDSVGVKITTPHNNMKEKFNFIINQISKNKYYFNRKNRQQVCKYLSSIQIQDLQKTWCQAKTRSLDIFIASKNHEQAFKKHQIQFVTSIEVIQKQSQYWPDFFTHKK